MTIKGKVAIVTGASSGIGQATALALAKAGAKVAGGARRTDKLDALKAEIKKAGGEAFVQKLDVTKKPECDAFVDAVVKEWGTVDILVNNAGLMPLSFFKNMKVDEWDRMIDVNLKGVIYCTAAAIPHMMAKKSGHIVNLSSIAGRVVFPAGSVYCATKHAVTAFSEGLRQEFSQRSGIRVTCIEPGVVDTELNNSITDASLAKFVESTKQMESLKAQDIANAILFAVDSPHYVNVNEIMLRPTSQER
ncbi:short-chain alcohol dehydrogenase [Candidatus Nitrososphaera evergladensis SR1]|uniref:Short-chain alcohol dehydrogenase n=1 Tax=Candidatus Nitrososphaera evergladensis SR1 TaxID=1459636 RepID=A0A075MNX3_9ARCH|nr:SDR family oxidoreductase [Candidatus Nitrososphaera evergladensis]AIF82512.1 short-chain alcohol dehydrogenase [Candidatus Nitrososphaera evergladensis SR1]